MIFLILLFLFACVNLCLGFALGMMFGYGPAVPAVVEQWLPWLEERPVIDERVEDEDDLDFFADEPKEPAVSGTVLEA